MATGTPTGTEMGKAIVIEATLAKAMTIMTTVMVMATTTIS
jgi:hypothetical protein